jgi:hypothetical protein
MPQVSFASITFRIAFQQVFIAERIVLLDFIHRLVSQKTNNIEELKIIDKISQYTRPQNSHKGQLLTTEQLTWAHIHMNP